MHNSIFATVIAALKNAEAEVSRMEAHYGDVQLAAQGVQARLDVLKVNERELEAKNNAMATEIAAARKTIEEAKGIADKHIADGHAERGRLIAEGTKQRDKMLADTRGRLQEAARAFTASD